MRLAQQEIRATVSVNMFELSSRKRDDDCEISSVRYKKGALKAVEPVHTTRQSPDLLHRVKGLQAVNKFPELNAKRDQVTKLKLISEGPQCSPNVILLTVVFPQCVAIRCKSAQSLKQWRSINPQ